jgi:nucleoid DNA-binding protein
MADNVSKIDLEKELKEVGIDLVKEIIEELHTYDKVASGRLVQSLSSKVTRVVVGVMDKVQLSIIDSSGTLKFVDGGRRPGKQPPTGPIMKWIDDRRLPIRKGQTKAGVAFVIARSIGRKGIKPTHIIKTSMIKIMAKHKELLSKASKVEIQKQLDIILKEFKNKQ